MSSGFTHITTALALCLGVLLGAICAKKFKSWNLWFFALAFLTGWIVHVVFYDNLIFLVEDAWERIWAARGGYPMPPKLTLTPGASSSITNTINNGSTVVK